MTKPKAQQTGVVQSKDAMPLMQHFMQFTPFRKLPTELRLAIWALSRPENRVVTLGWTRGRRKNATQGEIIKWKNLATGEVDWGYLCAGHATPAIFHVNRESRGEAFKLYKPILKSLLQVPAMFDFERDTLSITCFGPEAGLLLSKPGGRMHYIRPKLTFAAQVQVNKLVETLVHLRFENPKIVINRHHRNPYNNCGEVIRSIADFKDLKTISCPVAYDLRPVLEEQTGTEWDSMALERVGMVTSFDNLYENTRRLKNDLQN